MYVIKKVRIYLCELCTIVQTVYNRQVQACEVPGRREQEVVRERRGHRGLHDEYARASLEAAGGEKREAREGGGKCAEEQEARIGPPRPPDAP